MCKCGVSLLPTYIFLNLSPLSSLCESFRTKCEPCTLKHPYLDRSCKQTSKNPSSIHPHPLVPFIFRGSALSSSSRRRVDRSEREFLGSVSSRGAGDLSSSSPLTMSTEDLSFVGSRSLSPKRNLNATTTSGLGEQANDAPART